TAVTITLGASDTFILRSTGGQPHALENDAFQPACHVLTTRDNQLVFHGPRTVIVTPSQQGCSTGTASDDTTPFISIISPNGGQTVKSGDNVQVFWTNVGKAPSAARLSLSTDGGATASVIADNVMNNGFYSWTVPGMASSSHARFRLEGIDQGLVTTIDLSDADFAIQGTSPEPSATPSPVMPAYTGYPPYDPAAATTAAASINDDLKLPMGTFVHGMEVCSAGSRIKGASSAAVYYCGQDGKRHAFPNQHIHDSWYQGFVGVITLTDSQLGNVPLGKNVTYRPGVRLVKINTDSKVYAVDANGTLRWVPDEWTAKRLYGDNWSKLVDDVSDAFFTDYSIGTPIPTN
ncbi:MAG: hypothetical protein RLZZ324_123, partial [Candidatus Parcubacteria bacterium]